MAPWRHASPPPSDGTYHLGIYSPTIFATLLILGRIFEARKHTMFARWDRMAKQFARIAKDITIAVRAGRRFSTGSRGRWRSWWRRGWWVA